MGFAHACHPHHPSVTGDIRTWLLAVGVGVARPFQLGPMFPQFPRAQESEKLWKGRRVQAPPYLGGHGSFYSRGLL